MTTTARLAAASTAAALLLTLGACATPRADAPHPAGTPVVVGAPGAAPGIPACDEVETLTADPALYRDEPRYGNAVELAEDVRGWAQSQPGFEELWLDRNHHGWVHVGFSGDADVDALQAELEAEFLGEGVVAVSVPRTNAELAALADRVYTALTQADATLSGYSYQASEGVVSFYDLAPDPAALEALAQFEGEPLCVDLLPEESLVPEGDQPTTGAQWRLLGHERGVGDTYRTGVATDDDQLAPLWTASGLPGEPGAVDWQREIVVWFGTAQSSSCPKRLDGVSVTGSTLHADLVVPGWPGACTADANPHSYVVAVERSMLPNGPFYVQLGAEDPPPGAPDERTIVDADLTAPGSRVELDAVTSGTPAATITIEDGHDAVPEAGMEYVWQPRPQCAGIVIGPFDGSLWTLTDDAPDWLEEPGSVLSFYPIDHDTFVAATSQSDHIFVRDDGAC